MTLGTRISNRASGCSDAIELWAPLSGTHTLYSFVENPAAALWPSSAAARRRPTILANHAVTTHLHPHRVTVRALVARIALHQGLGPELTRVLLGRRGRDGVEFGFVEDGGARLDLQGRGGLEGRDG